MKKILIHFKKLDWVIIASVFFLTGIGLLSIYSSSLGKGDFSNFKKQLIYFGIGLLLMFLFSFLDWRALKQDPYLALILYFICLISLVLLFFFAPEIRGVKRWYKVGQFSIDPIEFIKIILIILLAKYFSMRHVEMYRIKHVFLSGIYILLPSVLIFLQPDLGSVIILFFLWIGILLLSGIKIRHFLILCLSFLVLSVFSWQFLLKDYQKTRVVSFVAPQLTKSLEIGWNQAQAKIAIGSGGVFGRGIGRGSQTQYGFLPEFQTDFIFASLAEESGLIGVVFLFSLFWILIWRTMRIATLSQSNFPRLFASGFSILLVSQIFINIGMNIGILPIIGIPLPFISYGGSSLISTFIGLGLLESIKTH